MRKYSCCQRNHTQGARARPSHDHGMERFTGRPASACRRVIERTPGKGRPPSGVVAFSGSIAQGCRGPDDAGEASGSHQRFGAARWRDRRTTARNEVVAAIATSPMGNFQQQVPVRGFQKANARSSPINNSATSPIPVTMAKTSATNRPGADGGGGSGRVDG